MGCHINVKVSHKNDWKYNHSNLLFPVKSIRHNVSHLGPYTPHFGVSYHGTMYDVKKISFSKCVLNWYFIIVLTLLYGFAYVWKQIWLVSDLKVRYVLCKTIWCLSIRKVSKDFQTESTLIYFIKLQMKKLVKFFANFILQKTPNEIQILFFIMV